MSNEDSENDFEKRTPSLFLEISKPKTKRQVLLHEPFENGKHFFADSDDEPEIQRTKKGETSQETNKKKKNNFQQEC